MTQSREELEQAALKSVCPCFYYDLINEIDSTDDYSLQAVIEKPFIYHYISEAGNPGPIDEFVELLKECPDFEEVK